MVGVGCRRPGGGKGAAGVERKRRAAGRAGGGPARVGLVSLGCAKNRVDSEVLLALLGQAGYAVTPFPAEADVLIVNTCSFIRPAKDESLQALRDMAKRKSGRCRALVAAGCLAQEWGRQLFDLVPGLDGVVGPGGLEAVVGVVEDALAGRRPVELGRPPAEEAHPLPRLLTTPRHYAYLKLAEGCSNRCTYCLIPRLRGSYRSRPPAVLVEEAAQLAALGVKELVLVAQDLTRYGLDLERRPLLPELLPRLAGVPGLRWVRLLYAHPARVDASLLRAMAETPGVVPYLDMPVQHGSDRILQAMGRAGHSPGGPRQAILDAVRRARGSVPDMTLRTTFLVGFPGETEADFEELCSLAREAAFDQAGVFTYSAEDGTPAAALPGQVPEAARQERARRLARLQARISARAHRRWVGRRVEVLVEGRLRGRAEGRVGRTPGQAPEVDPVTRLPGSRAAVGRMVQVEVTRAGAFWLEGEACQAGGERGGPAAEDGWIP